MGEEDRDRLTPPHSSDADAPPALLRGRGLVLRLMKRERDLDAHEDADSEAPVNVNDAILSFEKELDRMSEAAAPRVKCAAHCRMLCTHPAAASMRTHVAAASPPLSGLLARAPCRSQAGGSKRRGRAPSSGDAEEEEEQAVVALRFDANEGAQPSCIKGGTMRYYQVVAERCLGDRAGPLPLCRRAALARHAWCRRLCATHHLRGGVRADRGPQLDARAGLA